MMFPLEGCGVEIFNFPLSIMLRYRSLCVTLQLLISLHDPWMFYVRQRA